MILIKKTILYIFLILSILFILALGITYYKLFMYLSSNEKIEIVKFHAENFIFFSIVAVLILLIFFFILLYTSRNFYKEIDKVIEISKNSNIEIDDFLKRIGGFGEKINELTQNISNISRLKTLQISSYWTIINSFIENFSDDLMLIAHDGYILNMSDEMFSHIGIKKKDVVKKNISEILNDFHYDEIENKLLASKTPLNMKNINIVLNKKKGKIDLTFYPIFDLDNNLTFTLVSRKERDVVSKIKDEVLLLPEESNKEKKSVINNLIKNFGKRIQKINIFKQKK